MQKYILLLAFLTIAACHEGKRHRVDDPFAMIDKHLTHTLAYHYMWPWSQLIKAAAALEVEDALEEPQIVSDSEKFRVNLNVKRFNPDELRIKVKNRYIIVEGRHKDKNTQPNHFMANHFVQKFVMPPGSKQDEVTAVLKENILCISVPKHEVPPPPPEREVPINVILPEKVPEKTENVPEKPEKPEIEPQSEDKIESSTEKKEVPVVPAQASSATPLEQLDLIEATTHVGKIRKKELKTTTKTAKDNEVTKGVDSNGLDYVLIEQDE